MDKIEEFVNEFLAKYEKKKKILDFILNVVEKNPEVKNDERFAKSVLIFSGMINDAEFDLMAKEGVKVDEFMDLVTEFEENILGIESTLEDLDEFEEIEDE